jgi:hypothetical protein
VPGELSLCPVMLFPELTNPARKSELDFNKLGFARRKLQEVFRITYTPAGTFKLPSRLRFSFENFTLLEPSEQESRFNPGCSRKGRSLHFAMQPDERFVALMDS